jgi:RNA polymerase sigma-70 factor (ECF subfamily)
MDQQASVQPTERSTADLVAAAQQTVDAFEHLYRRFVPDIYRFCYRRLGSETDAADATSTIFTRALINIRVCNPEHFRPWLFAIARNVLIDVYRSRRPVESLDQVLASGFDPASSEPTPDTAAEMADQSRHLIACISTLADDQRAVMELRLAGLTTLEIAETLGKKRNAIDQLQHRAVVRLRQLLTPVDPNLTPETQP